MVDAEPEHEETAEEGDGEAGVYDGYEGRVHQEQQREEGVVVEHHCNQQHHDPALLDTPILVGELKLVF